MSRVPGTYYGAPKARIWTGAIPGTHEAGFVEAPIIEDVRGGQIMREALACDEWAFTMGECRILLGHEPGGVNGEMRWHLTISCPDRHPSWDEIKVARYRLLGPHTVMAMVLPQPEHYVNVPEQDHVFQLWEIEDESRFWENG